jgi:hypothetical protein
MKIGRNSNLHPGHIAGAASPRLAQRIPVMNVPCLQAILLAFLHAAIWDWLTALILDQSKAG